MKTQFLQSWKRSSPIQLATRIKKLATVNKEFAQNSAPLIAKLLLLEEELKAEECCKLLRQGMAVMSESTKEALRQIFKPGPPDSP